MVNNVTTSVVRKKNLSVIEKWGNFSLVITAWNHRYWSKANATVQGKAMDVAHTDDGKAPLVISYRFRYGSKETKTYENKSL